MKKIVLIALGISFMTILPVSGDTVPTEGTWSGKGVRSLASTPSPPVVSIEGYNLSIYFSDEISGLLVTVTDQNGSIVYQETISGSSNDTYNVPLGVSPGMYQLTLAHFQYGLLSGMFSVE
jgi:hypothetical protein